MATTYTTAKVALDEIAQRSHANSQRLAQARAFVNTAVSDLGAMETAYETIVNDITAAAQAMPGDAAIQALKAELDKLVSDFGAVKTKALADQAALA